jgi:hypothetical protein
VLIIFFWLRAKTPSFSTGASPRAPRTNNLCIQLNSLLLQITGKLNLDNASSANFAPCTSLKTRQLKNPKSPVVANPFCTNYIRVCQEKSTTTPPVFLKPYKTVNLLSYRDLQISSPPLSLSVSFVQYFPPPSATLLAKKPNLRYTGFLAKRQEKAKLTEQKAAFAHLNIKSRKTRMEKAPANNGQ